jgi:hypothetical protein
LVRNISGAFGVAIFSTLLTNTISTNVLSIAQNSVLRAFDPIHMQQFIGLITLKAQVAGYAAVFQVAAIVIMIGSFAAFLIRVPREQLTKEHAVIAE